MLYIGVWRLLFAAATPQGFFLVYTRSYYFAAIFAVLLGGIVFAGLAPLVRAAPAVVRYIASVAFLSTIAVILNELRKANEASQPTAMEAWKMILQRAGTPILIAAGLVLLVLYLRYATTLARWYWRLLLPLSVFALVAIVRSLWILATFSFAAFSDSTRPTHPGLPAAHRVIFIVFDEMDNELAFTNRPAGLALPNFDAFRNTAVTFDSTYSPGPNTIESMPSYLIGSRVKTLKTKSANSFVALLRDGTHVASDTAHSIFSDLASRGGRSAIVGFALPYCRLPLTSMVDKCESIPIVSGGSTNDESSSFLHAVKHQAESLLPFSGRRERIQRIQHAVVSASALAADPAYSLVMIHLPLPHYPWIWSRKKNDYVTANMNDAGYLDNLALADRVMGQIRGAMQRSGTWDSTTVIVTADHPWRLKLLHGPSTDSRIPFMIKLPGMKQPEHIAAPTNSIVISSLIPSFINFSIPDTAKLEAAVLDIERDWQKPIGPRS